MKLLKLIDLSGQALIFVFTLCYVLPSINNLFFLPYFLAGGWQLGSAFVHFLFKASLPQLGDRRLYVKAVFVVFIITLFSGVMILLGLTIFILTYYLLLIFTPILACFYFYLTIKEYRIIRHRAFIHLK
jgi:hypothetical protein